MADGRNHVPCCIQERVPDICQDVCRGEYTAITDNIKTHFSCSSYTEQTLACIVEGIGKHTEINKRFNIDLLKIIFCIWHLNYLYRFPELLPSPPENVEVEALNEKSIKVDWSTPISNEESITMYEVNVTSLKSLSDKDTSFYGYEDDINSMKHSISVKVPASQNSTVIQNLVPFTMYDIRGKYYKLNEV